MVLEEEKGYSFLSVSKDSGSHTGWKPGAIHSPPRGAFISSVLLYLFSCIFCFSPPISEGDYLDPSTSLQGPVWGCAQKALYLGSLHHLGCGIGQDLSGA